MKKNNNNQQSQMIIKRIPVFDVYKYKKNFDHEIEEVFYMYEYENPLIGIIGMQTYFENQTLTSIDRLKKLTKRIYLDRFSASYADGKSTDKLVEILNKGYTIICHEGVFIWDSVAKEFLQSGDILDVVPYRGIKIDSSFEVYFGNENKDLLLKEKEEYSLLGEYACYDDEGDIMYMLVVEGEAKDPIIIPDDPRFIKRVTKDLAIIDWSYEGEK